MSPGAKAAVLEATNSGTPDGNGGTVFPAAPLGPTSRAMVELTALERAALEAILAEQDDDRDLIAGQLRHAIVTKRENTGSGFYTDLSVQDAQPVETTDMHRGVGVWISVEGMEHGLGMILHYKDGLPYLLEGYGVGNDDTSVIDFESAPFALTEYPSRFNPNVS